MVKEMNFYLTKLKQFGREKNQTKPFSQEKKSDQTIQSGTKNPTKLYSIEVKKNPTKLFGWVKKMTKWCSWGKNPDQTNLSNRMI